MAEIDTQIGQVAQWEFAHAMEVSLPRHLRECVWMQGAYFEH